MRQRIILLVLLLAVPLYLVHVGSAAESPPPAPSAQPSQRTPTSQDLEAVIADLQQKRTAAVEALERVDTPSTLRQGAPPGVSEADVLERRSLLQQLVHTYDRHIDEAHKLAHSRQRLQEAEREAEKWEGFATPPPYSVLIVDELRDAVDSVTLSQQGIQTRLTMIDRLADLTTANLQEAQEQARQAAERAEGLRDPLKRETAAWARDLAQLRERVTAARASMLDTAKKQVQADVAEARERAALLERQVRHAEQHLQFTEDDYKKITSRLDTAERELLTEIEQAVANQASQRRAVAAAEERVARTEQAAAAKKKGRSPQARAEASVSDQLELQRVRFDTANLRVDLLRQHLDGIRQERQIWERRFAAARDTVPLAEEREAMATLASTEKLLQGWREYGFQQLAVVGGHINEVTSRMDEAEPSTASKHLTDMVRAFRDREALYRRVLQHTDALITLIGRRQAEIAHRQATQPLATRIEEWGTAAAGAVRDAWNVELFVAEDTIEVDGKAITGRRSITIGKIFKALAILLGGYWLSLWLARFAERKAISRFNVDPQVANIIRQWAMAFLFSILVIVTLMSVKIPLTAFAFLGGALAIAVGFGMQTLLKNVISGLLLLMERPLRVGDVIEVDGVHGLVTTIGLRSSTIRDANGVETLIPNSNLLEKNLTNWTYSSYRKRYQLPIKVAAGADTRRVKDLLVALARDHGQVLKEPEPYVLLEELTEGALVFSLQYWIEMGPAADPPRIASDLRYMIDTHFAEAGIGRK